MKLKQAQREVGLTNRRTKPIDTNRGRHDDGYYSLTLTALDVSQQLDQYLTDLRGIPKYESRGDFGRLRGLYHAYDMLLWSLMRVQER